MATKENQGGKNGAKVLFSKEDIREQYCITRKELQTFEDKRSKKLFGCLVKASCAGSSKDKKTKLSCIQNDEPSVAYGEDNRQSETKTHESLSKKESSEYEDAGFRYRPKPFCLQNPNRFQYNPEATSQAETSSIRMLPCRSASARPRLQSQHSSQGSITSSRTYLPNRSYEISYVPQTQPDKQVSGCRSVDALNDVAWRGSSFYEAPATHLPEYSMTLDSRHHHHSHHHYHNQSHLNHSGGGVGGTTSHHGGTPRPKSVAAGSIHHHQEQTDGSASMVRSNTVGGGLEDVDAMLVGPMATSTPLNVSRNRCNVCHCSSFSVDNQENLADVTQYYLPRSFEESLSQSGRMSAARRALQRTQATQTATATADNTTCTSVTPTSSRTPEVPPDYLTLSPRTAAASASSSRKSSRRRKASRDSSSRKAYTSIDSDTDESIDDEIMEVDLQGAQHRLLNTSSHRQSASSYQQQSSQVVAMATTTETPSPELKSQGRQRSLSKASSFDASSTTLTTVDALLNTTFDAHEETPVKSTSEKSRSRRGSAPRRGSRSDSQKQTMSYAQYLLQPACEFQDDVSGSFSAEVLSATVAAENLNSPDSESSSSRFTERESSCKSSTSSSAGVQRGVARAEVRMASLGPPLEEVKSDSTSAEYMTATEGKNSKTITKGLSSHEGSTSFESACEPSSARASDCQSDPGQRSEQQRSGSLERSSLPSPPAEMRLAEHVEIPCSSEEDSTKKEDEAADEDPVEDDQSSEGEYSLGAAEGIEGETDKSDDDAGAEDPLGPVDDDPMEITTLPSPIETSSPKMSHKRFPPLDQQPPTHICEVFEDEMHGKALILPLMTFRDVQNALGRADLRQYDELSTVSEVSEENSTSEHQNTERYTPTSSCGSTGTIKRIYHRPESPHRRYIHEAHNEASVLDQDSTELKDTSAELNASNESGGTCIEVTPNDSADSLSMTFKAEELRAIMFGSRLQGQSEQPSLEEEETAAAATTTAAATCEMPTTSTHETEPTKDILTEPEQPRPAALPPPMAPPRTTTVLAEIHQREIKDKVSRKSVLRDSTKEGSSTEPGTPSSTPTSNSSSSGRKDRVLTETASKRCRSASRGPSDMTTTCSIITTQVREDSEDFGMHADSFLSSRWIYITSEDEMMTWRSNNGSVKNNASKEDRSQLIIKQNLVRCDSTDSERAFQKQYTTITHRMIHRKASLEMYKRVMQRSLEPTKTVKIERQNGEFGFRIHGSRPVVVSLIEKGTPAESCGLEVGDIIVSINGVSVMDASHTEVVRVAHAGAETLKLELARTCHILAPKVDVPEPEMQGYLQRLFSSSSSRRWCRRYFVLKKSGRLSWFMAKGETDPLGALMVENLKVERVIEPGAEHAFKLTFEGGCANKNNTSGNGTYFAADDEDNATKWIEAFKKMASTSLTHQERFLKDVEENLARPVNSISQPDCQGFLCKFNDKCTTWRNCYLVLKDASLYIYEDRNDQRALGVYLLHGYRVQSSSTMGKKNIFEAIAPRPFANNLLFLAETEQEKKRWLASLEYSIDRWLKV